MDAEWESELLAHPILYVPWIHGRGTFAVGEHLGRLVASKAGRRPVVVAPTQAAVASRKNLAAQNIVTERSGFVPDNAVVIAWCPTRKLMQKLNVAKGSTVVLVEAPSRSLEAWAKLIGAYNVFTHEVMAAALTEASTKALQGIVWEGYNGWHDEIAETLTLAHLRELDEAEDYDREIVLQYAEMEGRFPSIHRLKRLLDRFEKEVAPAADSLAS